MSEQQSQSGGQQDAAWQPLVFEGFTGLNTEASRPGIKDTQLAWCDGWMPIGESNLRTMWGIGASIFTTPGGTTLSWFGFGNVGTIPMGIFGPSDGSVWRYRFDTLATAQVAPAGTITTPATATTGLAQWGGAFIILVAQQANGYFFIDPTLFYGPGTLAPGTTLVSGGSGYSSAPAVNATGGSGTGATFVATVSGGAVISVAMTNPGSGYVAGDAPTLVFSGGGGTGANFTIATMPFGVGGTQVETYQSRVWVVNSAQVRFTAPQSTIDFSTTNGGGSFTSNDSFLRAAFTNIIQTNGFLYLIADSSVNYIAGVTTSGSPAVTTFTNQNADPECGTPYQATATTLGSNIIFANAFGVQVSYGGRVTKVSYELDGVYASVPAFGGLQPTACKAIVFGKRVYVLLIPIVDPITNTQVNKLFLWDEKRWWSTNQDVPLTAVASLEIASVFAAYGTDGTHVYPLFQQPSTLITKTAQSKLWAKPSGYMEAKATNRVWMVGQFDSTTSPSITVNVDAETTSSPVTLTPSGLGLVSGFYVAAPTAVGQNGSLLGLTVTTNAADFSMVSVAIDAVPVGYRG